MTRPGRPLSPALCDELLDLYRAALDARVGRELGQVSVAEVLAAEAALPQRLIALTDWSEGVLPLAPHAPGGTATGDGSAPTDRR